MFLKSTQVVNFAMQKERDVDVELKQRKVEAITYEVEQIIQDHYEN